MESRKHKNYYPCQFYPMIRKHLLASRERFHTALMKESTKRKMKEAEEARTFASLVPSAFHVKSKNWCNYANSESDNSAPRLMHAGRPGSKKFIDVGLIHPDFAKIRSTLDPAEIHPSQEDFEMAITLASTMTDMYEQEANRQKVINDVLSNLLSTPLHLSPFSSAGIGPYQSDGTSGTNNNMFINVEYRNKIDSSSGDPFMQNIAYYHNFLLKECQKKIHNHHHPWLLIECVGNLMAKSTAVMGPTNRTIFNMHATTFRLCSIFNVGIIWKKNRLVLV